MDSNSEDINFRVASDLSCHRMLATGHLNQKDTWSNCQPREEQFPPCGMRRPEVRGLCGWKLKDMQKLARKAEQHFTPEVRAILKDRSRDSQHIERFLPHARFLFRRKDIGFIQKDLPLLFQNRPRCNSFLLPCLSRPVG